MDALLPGIRARDNDAFGALYQIMADRLFRFARRLIGDVGAAEDAVQQAFLELVKGAPELRGDGRAVAAWLFRSVRFTCLDELRRRSRRPEDPVESIPETGLDPPDEPGLDPELEAALARLSERQRTALHLKYVVGLDGHGIALAMGSSRAATYAMIARAEQRLGRILQPVESGQPAASLVEEGQGG